MSRMYLFSRDITIDLSSLHISESLYQEQVKYFGTPDGKLRSMTYDELRQLPILDSVIRETLRIHPPIHSMMRKVRDDIVVPATLASSSKDHTLIVPKGHYVLASPAVSQVDPNLWKEPQEWDPSRWSDPEGVAAEAYKSYNDEHGEKVDFGFGAVSKGTESPYQPFGAGRHRCIGEQVRGFLVIFLVRIQTTSCVVCISPTWHTHRDCGTPRRVAVDCPVPAAQLSCMSINHPGDPMFGADASTLQTMITMPKKPTTVAYRRRHFD
jgi:hypothetical protein